MLGEELKQLRGERRLGVAALARLSGISRPHIYAIESGDAGIPRGDTLLKLARGLSAWRGGDLDPDDCAYVFHRLQVAAGYPVEAPQVLSNGETVTTPVPEPLAGSILEILESWPRWSQLERETAARLLDVASDIGHPDADTVGHNGDSGILAKHKTSLALYLDWMRSSNPDALAIAPAPTRELAYAGR